MSRFSRFLLTFSMLGLARGFPSLSGQASPGPGVPLRVVPSDDQVVLEWHTPPAEIQLLPDGTASVEIPGFDQTSVPGAPRLPFTAALIAIPPGSEISLDLLEIEEEEVPLPAPLIRSGRPQGVEISSDGQVLGGAFSPALETTAFHPNPVEIESLGVIRGVSLARVIFYPARLKGENLSLASRVKAAVRFEGASRTTVPAQDDLDPLQQSIKSAVVNPASILPAQLSLPQTNPEISALESDAPVVAVEVTRLGLSAITFEGLQEIGYPVENVDPDSLQLARSGVEIPYEWDGDGDGSFEPGERLLFYAEPRFSRWTQADVYFLSEVGTPGSRIGARPADPAGLQAGTAWVEALAESNRIYTPDCYCAPIPAGRDGDRWVWDELRILTRPEATYEIELSAVDTARPGSLILWLIGSTEVEANPDHHVEISLNDTWLGEIEWDGKEATTATFEIPAGILKNGANDLMLSLPGLPGVEVEGVWLDAFSIRYAWGASPSGDSILFSGEAEAHSYEVSLASTQGLRAYEITDPEHPVQLEGLEVGEGGQVTFGDSGEGDVHRYFLTNEDAILSPAKLRLVTPLATGAEFAGADYLIISHPEFIPALDDLQALREAQGMPVAIEDVTAIYDAFGDGRPEPEAIRAFLAHAYENWELRPLYVLLVGDGTSDPKQYLASSSRTFVPPYLADVDPWAGETAADNRYVTLEGDDILPDMLIGRLPVNSLSEATAVANKITGFEQRAASGSWTGRGIFVADDPDGGGNFPALSDSMLAPFLANILDPERLYFSPPEVSASEIHEQLLNSWNSGASLVVYTGHASIHQWAAEQFLHLEEVDDLDNRNRLPVVLEMTCFTGSFHVPGFSTLDEALLRHTDGGSVAVWGPTGLGIATGHAALADGFLHSIYQEGADLGTAALAGKLNLFTHSPGHLDLIDTFTLLGDPATQVNLIPGNDSIYLPLIQQ